MSGYVRGSQQQPSSSRVTEQVKTSFLEALARRGTVKAACEEVGITRYEAKKERAADPIFDRLWSEAIEEIADLLESEAMRRAVTGYETRTVVRRREKKETRKDDGEVSGAVSGETEGEVEQVSQRFSEGLLILLLKANRPDKFGGRATMTDANFGNEIAADRDPPLIDRGQVA